MKKNRKTLTLQEAVQDVNLLRYAELGLEKTYSALCDRLDPGFKNPPVVGRAKEIAVVDEFVKRAASGNPTAYMLYISGIPGTGKTTIVNKKIQEYGGLYDFETCYINGLEIASPLECFSKIWKSVRECVRNPDDDSARAPPAKALTYIRKYIEQQQEYEQANTTKKPPPFARNLIVVLDEMDAAIGASGTTVLFDLFDLLGRTDVFAFIGIANRQNIFESFKFTEKHTMRLGSRTEKFQRIVFNYYTTSELVSITKARIEDVKIASRHTTTENSGVAIRGLDVIEPNALQIAMMKVQKYADGDCRAALDILKLIFSEKQLLLGSSPDIKKFVSDSLHVVTAVDVQHSTKDTFGAGAAAKVTEYECLCLVIFAYESCKIEESKLGNPVRKELVTQRYQILAPQVKINENSLLAGCQDGYQSYLTMDVDSDEDDAPMQIPVPDPSPSPLQLSHDCFSVLKSLMTLNLLTDHGTHAALSHTVDKIHLKSILETCPDLKSLHVVRDLQLNDVGY
eukprot:TRINITY_DN22150_c0_g1_i1.p1 TRINITY_DN22150_c0_g1~~TRINITY_DN22150_c0_g1_i1.p1  ORF type:complete len:526 (+),score=122.36 TRINITY_DN22150_c0_g1_i1:47-1579(+)